VLEPFERDAAEGPFQVQQDLQEKMQALVGIVRLQNELEQALVEIDSLKTRSKKCHVAGHREYNPGWHTAIDLENMLVVSEAIARCAIERKESRGGHFRDDFPKKDEAYSGHNHVVRKGADGGMVLDKAPIPALPEELGKIIEEMK
jgi:succinate dehydrogenase / fumarate reductase flavoprotein subunit